jgi:hypothetical protein
MQCGADLSSVVGDMNRISHQSLVIVSSFDFDAGNFLFIV